MLIGDEDLLAIGTLYINFMPTRHGAFVGIACIGVAAGANSSVTC